MHGRNLLEFAIGVKSRPPAPFVAGVAVMPYSRFVAFNVFGGIGWVILMTMAGYFLGGIPFIQITSTRL